MAGTYLGLDIGSKYIKAVEARGGGGRVEVTGIAIAPTPPDTFDGGAILDAQRLGQAIRQMLRDAGIGTKQVVSAAASNISVVVRVVEVPAVSDDKELATQMQWEIERQIPFAATQTIMDYARIERPEGTDPSQQNIEVLLAVAQQDFIDQHVEVLFAAGLNPKAIDVVPLAMGVRYSISASLRKRRGIQLSSPILVPVLRISACFGIICPHSCEHCPSAELTLPAPFPKPYR